MKKNTENTSGRARKFDIGEEGALVLLRLDIRGSFFSLHHQEASLHQIHLNLPQRSATFKDPLTRKSCIYYEK